MEIRKIFFGTAFLLAILPLLVLAAPNTPSNSSPSNGATGQSVTPTLTSSAYSAPNDDFTTGNGIIDNYGSNDLTGENLESADNATTSNGVSTRYMNLDDTDERAYRDTPSFLVVSSEPTSGTVAGWFTRDTSFSVNDNDVIFAIGGSDTDQATDFGQISMGIRYVGGTYENKLELLHRTDNSATSNRVYGNTAITDTNKHFFAFVSTGTSWKIFLDSGEETVSVFSGSNNGDWFSDIGTVGTRRVALGAVFRDGVWGGGHFDGKIDEITVWDSELTSSEITELYNSGSAMNARLHSAAAADLISYWRLGESLDHAASQWQITTTSGNYASPVYDSGTDTTNLVSRAVPAATLSAGTTYYWHVRHQDTEGNWSSYSTETSFSTAGGTVTLEGTVYSNEGTTNIGAGITVRLLKNGVDTGLTDDTDSSGLYSIPGVTISSGDILTLYLDDETQNGAMITQTDASTITGLNIYQNYIIVRHEGAGPITNTNMDTANNGDPGSDDIVIPLYDVSGGVLTATSGIELLVNTGDTYTPGGAVNVPGTIDVNGTLTMAGNALTLGTLDIDGIVSATTGAIDVNGALTIAGTLTAPSSTLSVSGTWTKSGTFTHSSGTVHLDGCNQTMTGSSSFATLTKDTTGNPDDSTDCTLTLTASTTQSIATALTMDGRDVNDRLNIVSATPGTRATFSFSGASTFTGDFLDVMDGAITDSSSGITLPINPANSIDSGNNIGWFTGSVTIAESGGSVNVVEGGTTDIYTMVLAGEPTASVVITITGDVDASRSPATLTFTTGNWSTPQTVTITAVDDDLAEGSHTGTITHTAASSDASFNGITISDVTANITDNDTASVIITESSGSTVVDEEGPTTDSYTVVLATEPTNTVTITVSGDTDVDVDQTTLTFTTGNWDSTQTIVVTAVDDSEYEGSHIGTITHSASSSDTDYDDVSISNVTVNITDNDVEVASSSTIVSSGSYVNKNIINKKEVCEVTSYIKNPIKLASRLNNVDDVINLEKFLNYYEGENLPVNGFYSLFDMIAVMKFQEKYRNEILIPAGLSKPTGYVTTSTISKINKVVCGI